MRILKNLPPLFSIVFLIACFSFSAPAQTSDQLATVNGQGSSVRWDVKGTHSEGTLTVVGPDGEAYTQEFKGGNAPEFRLVSSKGERMPDGQYIYELRVTPVLGAGVKDALKAAREKGNEKQTLREMKKRGQLPVEGSLVQSGSFQVVNGMVIAGGGTEEGQPGRHAMAQPATPAKTQPATTAQAPQPTRVNYKVNRHHPRFFVFDQVIPDDLIVQGSICAGFDCVNNESFGTDTLRLKENNTRIGFLDTSTSAGFAANDWEIRANDQPSGGANYLGFVDTTTGRLVFLTEAGAPANALRVASSGNIGIGTATPVLDVHANTTDTPAIRLEQNNSGGFTAQTWDIGANEANFFVRDVTGGSRLSLRIRPGAPTSSLDIAASGNVGINNAAPTSTLDVSGNTLTVGSESGTTNRGNNTTKLSRLALPPYATASLTFGVLNAAATVNENIVGIGGGASGFSSATSILFSTAANNNTDTGTERMRILSNGRVGIGTPAPDQLLSVNGDASKVGGGSWQSFSDQRLKNIKSPFTTGLSAVMKLQPVRFQYRPDNAVGIQSDSEYVGFSAQSVQKVVPEAVNANSEGYLMVNNDPIIWTMLNAIKEQQKEITELKREIRRLKANTRRRK